MVGRLTYRARRRLRGLGKRRRSFRVARKGVSKKVFKGAKRAAKVVLHQLAETKRFSMLNEQWSEPGGPPDTTRSWWWFYRNIVSPLFIELEDGKTPVEGFDLSDMFLKIKYTVLQNFSMLQSAGGGTGDTTACIVLLAATDAIANIIPDYISGTSHLLLDWFIQQDPDRVVFNGSQVKVLMKKKIRMKWMKDESEGTPANAWVRKSGVLRYKWKGKKHTMERADDSLGLLKGWNYYLLVGYRMPFGAPTSTTPYEFRPVVVMDSYLYYKDI